MCLGDFASSRGDPMAPAAARRSPHDRDHRARPSPCLTMPGAPLAFHVMAKPTGAICNLDCEYCFFLSKEMLYPGSRFRMAEDLQEKYIAPAAGGHAGRLRGGGRLAGRRADDDGPRLLPPVDRAAAAVRAAGAADPEHDADQRHAARRRVGRVPEGARVPGRDLDRRATGDARRLPGRQGRQAHLRPGAARAWMCSSATGSTGTC